MSNLFVTESIHMYHMPQERVKMSRNTRVSHVQYEWVMSHLEPKKKYSPTRLSYVTFEWGSPRLESIKVCHTRPSHKKIQIHPSHERLIHFTFEWGFPHLESIQVHHTRLSHEKNPKKSCHTRLSYVTFGWDAAPRVNKSSPVAVFGESLILRSLHAEYAYTVVCIYESRTVVSIYESCYTWVLCGKRHIGLHNSTIYMRLQSDRTKLPPQDCVFVAWFPDQEPSVRDLTTRCDRRISSWNLLHTALDQGT